MPPYQISRSHRNNIKYLKLGPQPMIGKSFAQRLYACPLAVWFKSWAGGPPRAPVHGHLTQRGNGFPRLSLETQHLGIASLPRADGTRAQPPYIPSTEASGVTSSPAPSRMTSFSTPRSPEMSSIL